MTNDASNDRLDHLMPNPNLSSAEAIVAHIRALQDGWPSPLEGGYYSPSVRLEKVWDAMLCLDLRPYPLPEVLLSVRDLVRGKVKADLDEHVANAWRQFRGVLLDMLEVCDSALSFTAVAQTPRVNTPMEKRDKWLYKQAMKGTPYDSLVRKLCKQPESWARLNTAPGVRAAIKRYAERNDLHLPPARQHGRPAGS